MDSKVKLFVFVNLAILIGLILYMRTRRYKRVSKFKISSPHSTKMASNQKVEIELSPPPTAVSDSSEEISLNVIFTWNGHDWDAYEVLGIPAGSPMDDVIKAYDEALASVDKQSQEFIHRAYESICEVKKK